MHFRRRLRCVLPGVLLVAFVVADRPARAQDAETIRAMTLLFSEHCIDCHSGPRPKGRLDLTTAASAKKGGKAGPAVVAGKLGESALWERIAADEMPPKKPLGDREKDLVKKWILAGAAWGDDPIDPFKVTTSKRAGLDWWSLQPVQRPTPPPVRDNAWVRTPIDRLVLAKLEAKNLAPSPEADRRTLIRRLSLDLLGLPPTPEEVDAFVSDPAPDAYERLVDRLLASPHYGERWARHWLDVVRFGESDGFERNTPRPRAWHYRDWIIRALNSDLPYDQFVRMQLAGDAIAPGDPEGIKATGFLVAGIHNTVVPMNKTAQEIARQDELEDLVGSVGQTFLGLTVNCGRCHDHKFDPIAQRDYYRLASALSGVTHGEREAMPAAARDEAARLGTEIDRLRKEIAVREERARQAVLAERKNQGFKIPPPPAPIAAWDFRKDLADRVGGLQAKANGAAGRTDAGLSVDGKSFVRTVPLNRPLKEKTLEAWVRLGNLKQRGGGVMTVQSPDGVTFDAIVFGEREPGRWMAGSNGFVRTSSFAGPEETAASKQPVHIAITYADNGTITGYRNGVAYGAPYRSSGPVAFAEGQAVVAFGIRHEPAGGDRMLDGVIVQARLYDRALSAHEVAASAGAGEIITEHDLLLQMNNAEKFEHNVARQNLALLSDRLEKLKTKGTLKVYSLVPAQPPVTHLLGRGQVTDVGEALAPGAIPSVKGVNANFGLPDNGPEIQRRVRLAEWIATKDNSLFGRVMVNRLWHHHFGVGIVETPNDFGFGGGRPTHPELLDWLASEFAGSGFRLKDMHRLIVTSAVYRQSSAPRAEGLAADADNRLLWRKRPLRAEGETLRDSMLAVAGLLNREVGGKGFTDYNARENSGTMYFQPIDPPGPEFHRRSVYRFTPRGADQGLLDVFDCPDPASAAPRRSATTTPLQALALWNGAFALRMADAMADRLTADATDIDSQVSLAYRRAFQRPPTAPERERATRLVRDHGLRSLCRALFNANEFLTVD